jgi:hypothetical protein
MLKFYSGFLVIIGVLTIFLSVIAAFVFVVFTLDQGRSGAPVSGGIIMALGAGVGGALTGAAMGALGELLKLIVKIERNTRPILLTPEPRLQ